MTFCYNMLVIYLMDLLILSFNIFHKWSIAVTNFVLLFLIFITSKRFRAIKHAEAICLSRPFPWLKYYKLCCQISSSEMN